MGLNEIPEGCAEIKKEPAIFGAAECGMRLKGNMKHFKTNDLESKCKVNERCLVLEAEIKKKEDELVLLRRKFKELEDQKTFLEEHVKFWQDKSKALEEQLTKKALDFKEGVKEETVDISGVDGGDVKMELEDESKVFQLMVDNKVLECEKQYALKTAAIWTEKCKELESRLSKLEESTRSVGIDDAAGSKVGVEEAVLHDDSAKYGDPHVRVSGNSTSTRGFPVKILEIGQAIGSKPGSHVRKRLAFEKDRNPSKKIAPLTPGLPPKLVVDISDSDEDGDMPQAYLTAPEGQGNDLVSVSTSHMSLGISCNDKAEKHNIFIDSNEEDTLCCPKNRNSVATPKRNRVANIVASESESENDDNVPIGHFMKNCSKNSSREPASSDMDQPACFPNTEVDKDGPTPTGRRLLRMSQRKERDGRKTRIGSRSLPTLSEDDEDNDDSEEDSSVSGNSLGSFIVESNENSEDSGASVDQEDESSDESNVDFGEILSSFRRERVKNFEWELEGEMLAAFGRDPELCMRAVCVLYRQQTADEKICKGTLVENRRGFSKFDAYRGTTVAEFIGDPHVDLKKSVEELQQFDSHALELCRNLAKHYSKQLFEIYQNKEDPFWC